MTLLMLDKLSAEDQAWFSGMKRDPVKRARMVVVMNLVHHTT
jgi:hypothetical protein